jgi:hypothetical protein
MSDTNASDSTSTPTASGLTVDTAAESIALILAREDGQPDDEDKDNIGGAEADDAEADEANPPEDETPAEEAPEEGADDAEAEDEEGAEDEEETEPPPAEASAITVEIDGKAVTLTKDEVAKGYLRTEDYTRKTQALAEERKQFHGHAQAVMQERQQYAALLPALEQQIKNLLPVEPNWEELAAVDPVEFNRQWAAKQLRDQKLSAIQQEQQRLHALAQQQVEQQTSAQAAQARELLLQKFPEWRDAAKGAEGKRRVRSYLAQYGYSDAEIGAVTDPRAVEIAEKARRYDEATRKGTVAPKGAAPAKPPLPQPARPAATAARPGTSAVVRRPVSEITRAKQRLAKTHSMADAAALIGRLI